MRIFLLPISTRQSLVYCQRLAKANGTKPSIADRITSKAAETWAKWESSKGGWQKKLTEYGNQGLKRIPYQEWGLKSFPPTNAKLQAEQITDGKKFDVIYPGNIMEAGDVPKVLARLASERKQLHYQRFIGCMIAVPFMLPFALIPIIPNIPGFYFAYRSWSHWRALRGSDHLDFILDHKLYNPISVPQMQDIYKNLPISPNNKFTFVTRTQVEEQTAPEEHLLLQTGSHDRVAKNLEVPELSTEVERAIWQIDRDLKRAQEEAQKQQQEEKARIEAPPPNNKKDQ